MTRSYSDIGALSSRTKEESASGSGGLSNNAGTTSLKKARFDSDEMLSAEDQYRSRQLKQKQQQQELELQQQGTGPRPKLGGRKDSTDGLDEVGFGANIDKSVAAAGENVTMDMFVVKSDVMKVVDIKVSLVETIQIFSLLDYEGACAIVSPIVGRTHVFNNNHQHQHQFGRTGGAGAGSSKRKLVETHMVKIAKAYVPAQAEENHANDNHLKGYYEDYEDARTTKSLSMYKLGMRIPETALTIQDRDLFKVDYMFVIKFFFKGRMGAFLELPIEIVSQYNHNRISTISGAISCVSNSVQIALPPVPILIKRNDGAATPSGATTSAAVTEVEENQGDTVEEIEDGAAPVTYSADDEGHVQTSEEEKKGGDVSRSQGAEEIQASSVVIQNVKDVTSPDSDLSLIAISGVNLTNTSHNLDPSSQDISAFIHTSSSTAAEGQVDNESSQFEDPYNQQPTGPTDDDTDIQMTEEEGILASSRLSKAEFAACANRQVGLTVARYNQMSSTGTTSSTATTTVPVPAKELKRATSKHASTTTSGGVEAKVPKIVIENVKLRSGPNGPAASSSASTSSATSTTTTTTTTTTTVISPALPILFDLTSAALPTPSPSTVSPPILAPLVIPRNSAGPTPMLMTPGVRRSSMGAGTGTTTGTFLPVADTITHSNSFPRSAKDTELHPPKLLPLRQGTNTSIYSFSSREDDHRHHTEAESSKSSGGLVAKIAKSLSSPLLRSRTGTNNISPNGSQANLPIFMVSPQNQQSSAFTLAATTLSALTLLSSVGQAAVSSEGKKVPLSTLPPARPLKSCIKKQSRSSTRARKKVTFAKGLTPVPSPTGSQVMLSEPIVLEPFKYKSQNQYPATVAFSASSSSSISSSSSSGMAINAGGMYSAQDLSVTARPNSRVTAATSPIAATARPMATVPTNSHQQHYLPQQQQITPSQGQILTGTTKSPNSASPRARMHHPFDSHPSRLSPLEKKHLDFQITQDLKSSSSPRGRTAASKDLSSSDIEHDEDEEEEDENEEEEEEEGEEEYEEDDEEEDDQETEEERIERRKQVRIAWLAKYGDAFKQVYGAVPELPPL
ncbi:hypothetical protein BGZ96_006187 [Linnemannia gamsii]|uniref:Arrestin C-terminal-like domain-containing protein n=1 Tax=Linnemannia gamsii TaxID=64522 RepID=A0ABQ7K2P6_9FUNG|nr:hypothetical protein BGZ96_006187 [Linnemannia gamsii]